LLRFDNVDNNFILEINEKTTSNASGVRKRKMPQYQQEIRSIVINDGMIEDLEWKSEDVRRERLLIEDEINSQRLLFQRLILEENRKYESLRKEYDDAVRERLRIDKEIGEIDDISRELLRKSESCILEANYKLKHINSPTSEIENNCILHITYSEPDKR
jgi:hypothetical protein